MKRFNVKTCMVQEKRGSFVYLEDVIKLVKDQLVINVVDNDFDLGKNRVLYTLLKHLESEE